MKSFWTGFLLVLVLVVGGVGYSVISSNQGQEDKKAMINAAKEGTASVGSGGLTVSDGNKRHVEDMISRCSTSIVDEGENHAKVTFTLYSGGVYDSENVERDESGEWHSTGSNGGIVQSEVDFVYGKH